MQQRDRKIYRRPSMSSPPQSHDSNENRIRDDTYNNNIIVHSRETLASKLVQRDSKGKKI